MPQTFPFLLLPAELRNKIYHQVLHWTVDPCNTSSKVPTNSVTWSASYRKRETAILLLNRQVHDEAFFVLYNRQVIFNSPCRLPYMKLAFGKSDLQHLRKVHIDINLRSVGVASYIWAHCHVSYGNLIRELVSVWKEKNALECLEITFLDSLTCGPSHRNCGDGDGEWEIQKRMLEDLLQLRGIKSVVVRGDIEPSFARELKTRMERAEPGLDIPAKAIEDSVIESSSNHASDDGKPSRT